MSVIQFDRRFQIDRRKAIPFDFEPDYKQLYLGTKSITKSFLLLQNLSQELRVRLAKAKETILRYEEDIHRLTLENCELRAQVFELQHEKETQKLIA